MGSQKRPEMNNLAASKVPGPGNYSFKTAIGEGPKVIMQSKPKPAKPAAIVPGPGAYEPKPETVIEKTPSIGIGYGDRNTTKKEKVPVPGPGAYAQPEKLITGPKYGFGTSKRDEKKKVENPGPGNYSIPTTFASLPSYEKVKSKS